MLKFPVLYPDIESPDFTEENIGALIAANIIPNHVTVIRNAKRFSDITGLVPPYNKSKPEIVFASRIGAFEGVSLVAATNSAIFTHTANTMSAEEIGIYSQAALTFYKQHQTMVVPQLVRKKFSEKYFNYDSLTIEQLPINVRPDMITAFINGAVVFMTIDEAVRMFPPDGEGAMGATKMIALLTNTATNVSIREAVLQIVFSTYTEKQKIEKLSQL